MTFESLDMTVTLPIGITVNSLIVLKSFLDPIIYTARMKDFKVAFHRMRYQVLSKCFPRCRWWTTAGQQGAGGPEDEGTMVHFNRSVLLGNNSMGQQQHSTIQQQTRRSIRFGPSKINRPITNGAETSLQNRDPALDPMVDGQRLDD